MLKAAPFAALAAIATFGLAAPAFAQLPPGVFRGEPDYKVAPAAAYALDPTHTAVIAKVSHIGYSLSVFRFDKVAGSLAWDPAHPAKDALKVEVETASITTPVPGFAAELSSPGFLKSAQFPKATFVSTAFHQMGASHARVDGQFTLMGKTVPLTFDVDLLGAGKGFGGHPRIGVEATSKIDPQVFGIPAMLKGPILLVIDAEFATAAVVH